MSCQSIVPTPDAGTHTVERRRGGERRRYTTGSLSRALTGPRRWHGRRRVDRPFAVLDRFDSGIAVVAVLLMLLSIADASFTLRLLERGGTELNPFMNWVLGHGVWAFCAVKMLLTAIPAMVLVACGNLLLLGRWRARSILGLLTGGYAALIAYELVLLNAST